MNRRLATVAAAAGLLLAGCATGPLGQPGDSSSSPAPLTAPNPTPVETVPPSMELGPGTYVFDSLSGGVGTITLPGEPDPETEELRKLVGARAVTYARVDVDNRTGNDSINMYQMNLYTARGTEVPFENLSSYLDRIRPSGDTADTDIYNRFIDHSNEQPDLIQPGERAEVIMVAQVAELPSFARMNVYPEGGFRYTWARPAE